MAVGRSFDQPAWFTKDLDSSVPSMGSTMRIAASVGTLARTEISRREVRDPERTRRSLNVVSRMLVFEKYRCVPVSPTGAMQKASAIILIQQRGTNGFGIKSRKTTPRQLLPCCRSVRKLTVPNYAEIFEEHLFHQGKIPHV
jgi:hypothetical protein